jgi:hypothetical protein
VQCALIVQRYSPYLKRFYEQVRARRGNGTATIALAHKLPGITYPTLKNTWVFEDFPNFVLARREVTRTELDVAQKARGTPGRFRFRPMFQNGPLHQGCAPANLFKTGKDFPQPHRRRAPLRAAGPSENLLMRVDKTS